jgi:cellulose synthase/poly-beta-1,6-N-acetylglucosamine synthase-like glycosyltransferase
MTALAAAACLYHAFLAAVWLARRRDATIKPQDNAQHRFAVLIPAHNEEQNLGNTLAACARIDYPAEKMAIYVIADNCTDRTAEVAVEHGTICLCRNDAEHRGKGYALEWAIPQVLAAGHDAVVVLDADCTIDAKSLNVFNAHLVRGDRVLQANYAVSNPDANVLSYMLGLANFLENNLFYAPKSCLGLFVSLRGTGMVLHRDILRQYPWRAASIVEDLEYSLELLRTGVRVRFVPSVQVRSEFPIQQNQLIVQRGRWIWGTISEGVEAAMGLVVDGVRKRQLALLDAGWSMLVTSRWLVILQYLLTLGLALVFHVLVATAWSRALLVSVLVIGVAYLVYVMIGAASMGLTRKRLRLITTMPWAVGRYLCLALLTVFVARPRGWNKTPRGAAVPRQSCPPSKSSNPTPPRLEVVCLDEVAERTHGTTDPV